MNHLNSKKSGTARTIIFKKGKLYKAVCLDFDIIEESESREEVELMIKEAIVGYIKNICLNKLDDQLLNRHADDRYWQMYFKYLKTIDAQKINTSQVKDTSIFTIPINKKMFCPA